MKQVMQAVKGTRDFYPEDMAFRNWLYGKIKEVSQKFGYQEYDGPEIEYLDLYADKTSQEILKGQTFTLNDRDNQTLVLRPELTPTFARMVAQRSQQLSKPIRWFSFGRCWRYEQPQKGRAREFFQWEINILGPESPEADAEMLSIAADYFKTLGLTPKEIVIKVSDREFIQNELKNLDLNAEKILESLRIMDKRDKVSAEDFREMLKEISLNQNQIIGIETLMESKDYSKSAWLKKVFDTLKLYPGALEYIEFDPKIIRGFDYYTRTVFEAWDRQGKLKRSLFGGGRFDNLTAQVGGDRVPGVGMAPGDIPIQILLEEYNKMPDIKPNTARVLVTVFSSDLADKSLEISSQLRSNNINTELWLDSDSKLEKQLKYADQKGIPYVIIIGPEEVNQNKVVLKNLKNKSQETLSLDEATRKLTS